MKFLASLIEEDMTVADIGCDHAYFGIFLSKRKIKSYGIDNKEQVLKGARLNLIKENAKGDVDLILSDGLEYLPTDVDTLVISGVGARNMIDILSNKKLTQIKTMFLLPHKDLFLLRERINDFGFKIEEEYLIFENKFYVVLKCVRGFQALSKKDQVLGPFLKNKANLKYYENLYQFLKDKLNLSEELKIVESFLRGKDESNTRDSL